MKMIFASFLVAFHALALAPVARAVPILYEIVFIVEDGTVFTQTVLPDQPVVFEQRDALGNSYFGLFSVDDEVLAADGIGKPGTVYFLVIKMEDNIWAYNLPFNNSFVGFRGPIPDDPSCPSSACLFAPSPGFDVVGSTITNLRGGVFGPFDLPFIDFSPTYLSGANSFHAAGSPMRIGGTQSWVDVQGSMNVYRIPEPDTLALIGLGLVGVLIGGARFPLKQGEAAKQKNWPASFLRTT